MGSKEVTKKVVKEKLTDETYWDKNWKKNDYSFYDFFRNTFMGISNYEFYSIFKKYAKKKSSVFEVGCAPANYLIDLKKKFNFDVYGIEYSKEGYSQIKYYLKKNKIKNQIIFGDFFDKEFLNSNKNKYDIVYSIGFIEHFENPRDVIDKHFSLVKNGGLLVISIPNLKGINKLLTKKEVLNVHNLNIMNLKTLKKLFSKYEILELRYSGGFFNFGLFNYSNWFLDKLRLACFAVQRILIDPIFILLYKIGIRISCKYTSPQITVVCRKK